MALLLALAGSVRAGGNGIDYAFEAFDPAGLLIATGTLHVFAPIPDNDQTTRILAARRHDRVADHQNGFLGPGDPMQGVVEGNRIVLGPGILSHRGYIHIEARFIKTRSGPFRGHWHHKHSPRTHHGEFRAWPINPATTNQRTSYRGLQKS